MTQVGCLDVQLRGAAHRLAGDGGQVSCNAFCQRGDIHARGRADVDDADIDFALVVNGGRSSIRYPRRTAPQSLFLRSYSRMLGGGMNSEVSLLSPKRIVHARIGGAD